MSYRMAQAPGLTAHGVALAVGTQLAKRNVRMRFVGLPDTRLVVSCLPRTTCARSALRLALIATGTYIRMNMITVAQLERLKSQQDAR